MTTLTRLCSLVPISVSLLSLVACGDVREVGVPVDELYGEDQVLDDTLDEPIDFRSRQDVPDGYGLPEAGQSSIADLLDILPAGSIGTNDASVFIAPGEGISTDFCQGPEESAALPMVIEGIVTIHPHQYVKAQACGWPNGQDEKYYGSYVIEDDTAGIMVLRDSRIAPFTAGDRVRLTVRGVTRTFGRDPDTAAIMISDYEVIAPSVDENGLPIRTVLYEDQVTPFEVDDVGFTRRIEGFVLQQPTDDNFNSMVIGDRAYSEVGDDISVDTLCQERCRSACRTSCPMPSDVNTICNDAVCPTLCQRPDGDESASIEFDASLLPVCWEVGIAAELGRRTFSPEPGANVTVTGPVVNNYGRKIWFNRIGQIQYL